VRLELGRLVDAQCEAGGRQIVLAKELGETAAVDQERFTWNWPTR
jgi:hypothetical protein